MYETYITFNGKIRSFDRQLSETVKYQNFANLEHPHEQFSAVGAVRGVRFEPDAFDQIKQQFARHGLNGRRQRFVVDVFREEIDGQGEIF